MAISKLQYEEAEIRKHLSISIDILIEYNKKVDEYTYIRDLIVKDREEKMQRLKEIEREEG